MLTLVVVLSLVTYRVTRFALEDSLIAQPRAWLKRKLIGWDSKDEHELDLAYAAARAADEPEVSEWRLKLFELATCQYCASAYVAAGAVALTDWRTSVPLPVWTWLAAMAGAVVIWNQTEG